MIELSQDNIGVTSGIYKDATCFYCVVSGNLILHWEDGTTTTLSCNSGDSFYIKAKALEVSSGTFHIGYTYDYF